MTISIYISIDPLSPGQPPTQSPNPKSAPMVLLILATKVVIRRLSVCLACPCGSAGDCQGQLGGELSMHD